jgi:uncharacterized spore protein YtfJ
MDTQALLRELGERLGASASVKSVYGEPVTAGDRTVIPIAKVFYSFGGGGGRGRVEQEGSGGGGGGVVAASPAGALEVTPSGVRFVGFHDTRLLGLAAAAGFAVGAAMALVLSPRKKIIVVDRSKSGSTTAVP